MVGSISITGHYLCYSQWCPVCLTEHRHLSQRAYTLDADITYILPLLIYSFDCGSMLGPRTALKGSQRGPENFYKVA